MNGGGTSAARHSSTDLRRATAERLRGRREEIHEAVIHRALSVAPPTGREAPGYVEALRAAIPSAVEHAFGAIELGEERVGPTPAAVFVQAEASARSKVGLEAVMRRYAVGYSTISDFLHQETRAAGAGSAQGSTAMQRDLAALFDRFVVEVSETYRRAEGKPLPSPEERRIERVARLLVGDLVDPAGLDYPIGGSHLAVIVCGDGHPEAPPAMARRLDRHLLIGERSVGRTTIWLGGREPISEEELGEALEVVVGGGLRVSLGEQGGDLAGWRRSRRQAEAAHLVGERCEVGVVRYRDVALVASALRDPDLAHFLAEAYLERLGTDPPTLRETVRTFLELGRNTSSTGAALGLARQTVAGRLQAAERHLGQPLGRCGAQLETALRLAELGG